MFKLLEKKKARDFIPLLKDNNGIQVQNDKENQDLVSNFYNKIFSNPPIRGGEEVTKARAHIASIREKTIFDPLKAQLVTPLSVEEIKESIRCLAPNKTPALDGLPNEFFKENLDLISPLLLLVWQESTSYGVLPVSVNTGALKLIHKKGEKDEISITCLTSIYKVFALALAKSISSLLDSLILKEQKGFIKGRYILDAIITLWESCDYAIEEDVDFLFFF